MAEKKTAEKKTPTRKAATKAPAKKKETVEQAETVEQTVDVITAQTILPSGIVLLSDGGRTSSSRGSNGFAVKVGDRFVKDGEEYRKVK